MWRRLVPLVIFLFYATAACAFNSNSPGGAVAGGSCTGGQFMSGISSSGVPICSTPSGGAPFPPGSPPQITGYSATNTGEAQTMVGDGTLARSGANQTTLTVTQINHITPGGVCSAGTFASTISSSGVPTCTAPPAPAAASITDAMLANAYSGVGACTAGSVATTLNRNAAPTCTALSTLGAGLFAPLTNPAAGQNNYAPLASPTFTGTTTVANLTAPGTATWTLPDGSTITSAGYNTVHAMGIGQAVGSDLLDITNNVNTSTGATMLNNNAGANAFVFLQASNGTSQAIMQQTGTGYTANPNIGANTSVFYGNGVNGVNVMSLDNVSTAPVRIWAGGGFAASFLSSGITVNTSIFPTYAPTAAVTLDTATTSTVAVANGASVALPGCSGVVILTDQTTTGNSCVFVNGGATANLIGQSAAACLANTAAPSAGHFSMAFNGSTYAIYNNVGGTVTFGVINLCTRHGV